MKLLGLQQTVQQFMVNFQGFVKGRNMGQACVFKQQNRNLWPHRWCVQGLETWCLVMIWAMKAENLRSLKSA